jgi:hypothetical protein
VWRAIHEYENPDGTDAENERDREDMKMHLARALGNMIERDGHKVCEVGTKQQLLTVLQGFYPEVGLDVQIPPNVLLTMLGARFHAKHGEEPTQFALEEHRADALKTATEEYEGEPEKLQRFTEGLDVHLDLTYDFPKKDEPAAA